MFGSNNKRFVVKSDQSIGEGNSIKIIVDTETGVNYICMDCMHKYSNLTPLLDKDGKIVIGR